MMKFYEMVSHNELLCAARDTGFSVRLLKPWCALYRGPRRASYHTSTSDVIHAHGAIIAGCSCATGLAKLMTITVLRHVGVGCNSMRIKNLIDDISVHSVGGPLVVPRELGYAFKEIVQQLQARELPLSWDKMGFLCIAGEVFGEIEDQVADLWPAGVPFPGRTAYHRDLGG